MPREEQYLGDIVQAASHIAGFLAGVDREAFMASELIRSAVLMKPSVAGHLLCAKCARGSTRGRSATRHPRP
jgi:uncharacterized protein with HEPN domain